MMKRKSGFTLVELLIALAIFSIVIVLGFNMLLFINSNFSRQASDVASTQTIRLAVNQISTAIKKATTVKSVTGGIEIEGKKYVLDSGTGVLKIDGKEQYKGIKTFIVTISGDQVKFSIESKPDKNGKTIIQEATVFIRK